jgi:hypothetical protein
LPWRTYRTFRAADETTETPRLRDVILDGDTQMSGDRDRGAEEPEGHAVRAGRPSNPLERELTDPVRVVFCLLVPILVILAHWNLRSIRAFHDSFL